MRFLLNINTLSSPATLPVNYQYPVSAAIYKILERADQAYSRFLHDTGYQQTGSLKSFKLFSFSDLRTPFKLKGDRLQLTSDKAELLVSFHLPQAAENFIKGLFMDQQLDIADKKSRASFAISQVSALPSQLTEAAVQEIILHPRSPVICGLKNERGNYDFLSPEHPEFIPMLLHNWKEKYIVLHGDVEANEVFVDAGMEVLFYSNPPKSRLITIKADTPAETKIRGFTNFQLKVRGRREALELLMNSGVGVYNAVGMGCVNML